MKTITTFLIVFCIGFLNAQNNWNWVSPSPQGNHLLSVHFANQTVGYSVGYHGRIIKTTDSGNSWGIQNSGVSEVLNTVFFTDENNGYAAGNNGVIIKTSDGGINWQVPQNLSTDGINSITFTN
jgi:photosystem II stability/assembly factor-like uncharacterized protein